MEGTNLFAAEDEYIPGPKLRLNNEPESLYGGQGQAYAPHGSARLILKDDFNIEHKAHPPSLHGTVFPLLPRAHFLDVPC